MVFPQRHKGHEEFIFVRLVSLWDLLNIIHEKAINLFATKTQRSPRFLLCAPSAFVGLISNSYLTPVPDNFFTKPQCTVSHFNMQ